MKCQNCGKVLNKTNKFCPECGTKVSEEVEEVLTVNETKPLEIKPVEETVNSNQKERKTQGFTVAGFVLSIIGLGLTSLTVSLLGLIFSNIALKNYNKDVHKNKGLAIAGRVVGICAVVFAALEIGYKICNFIINFNYIV